MYHRKYHRFTTVLALLLVCSLLCGSAGAAAPAAPQAPSVTAASAIVMDCDSGEVLYEKDADTMRVPASMTKVMTAYLIFEELEAGRLTLDTMVPISAQNARKSLDGSSYPASVLLTAGSSVSVDTLLRLILIPSASASCIVMAEYISGSEAAFVQRMNETARALGMTAEYENSHGAHVHYLTARSQAILVREFIHRFPQILDYTSLAGVTFNGRWYPNTNKLLPGLDYAYQGADGFKTGTISAAGYCLSATAVRDGHRLISVVMKSSNDRTRHTDSAALLDYGFALLDYRSPFADVSGHWCRDAVTSLDELGVELHTDGTSFRPGDLVTRAEFTAMLYTAMAQTGSLPQPTEEPAEPYFYDTAGSWAEDYIIPAARLGLITGSDAGYFSPERPITRQEMTVILDRCLDLPDENGLGFSDDGDIALWALEAAARTSAAGLFQGSGGRLMPLATSTRAEAAAVISRVADTL